MADSEVVLHLFIINSIGGATVVLLLETEPGVVEFPRLTLPEADLDDEEALLTHVQAATGMVIEIHGFLDPPAGARLQPEGSRFLLARLVSGSPRLTLPHIGWEWTPGSTLASMPFAPKLMVDELKSFMNV